MQRQAKTLCVSIKASSIDVHPHSLPPSLPPPLPPPLPFSRAQITRCTKILYFLRPMPNPAASPSSPPSMFTTSPSSNSSRKRLHFAIYQGGREGEREGGREGGRKGGRDLSATSAERFQKKRKKWKSNASMAVTFQASTGSRRSTPCRIRV
jgi:hypothetical protein